MAYEKTDVPAIKSQQKIREMIMAHGGFGIAFVSERDPEGKFPSSEGFQAKVIIDKKPYAVKIMAKVKKVRDIEQEERRIWRVLFYHMKSVFESADSGVMEFRELMALTYLTQWRKIVQNLFAVTGLFALFLLLCLCGCATRAVTDAPGALNTERALTKNHLPLKGESWLPLSVPKTDPISVLSSSQRQREKSLPKWNSLSRPITTSLKSSFRTRLHWPLILSLAFVFFLNLSTGNRAITNRSNAGDLSRADRLAAEDRYNIEPKPAERRVFASGLAYGSNGGDDLGGTGVPPWIASPYHLVSWWEMLKFSADAYFHLARHLEMWAIHREEGINNVTQDDLQYLKVMRQACQDIGLKMSVLYIDQQLIPDFNDGRLPENHRFADRITILSERIMDELSLSLFLYIPNEKAAFYVQKEPPFGLKVTEAFPVAISDIEEASKCLALGRATASVFHLMRVMEVGLKALAKGLDIPYAPSWESYLNQIETKITQKHNKKTRGWKKWEPFYRDVAGDLQMIKIAWRNPTMHIVKSYTPEEAEDIFRTVRAFIRRLSISFTEKGPIKDTKENA